jgi:U32 family peptidase
MNFSSKIPELLLPVGDREMCLAAVHGGADAIYVGVPKFNARGRTHDHELSDLKKVIDYCHLYGVKVHLAFNVLIFENEIPEVIELLKQMIPMGPDAFIVQDLGLVRLIKSLAPNQVVHGSTQMTITNADAIAALEDLDIKRFVLARENSLPEVEKIRASTDKELEVFVHGALCVAYSGQCFTSESLGGRSANRGQCAQSCRLSYDMYVDEKKYDLKGRNFIVSPKDLCGIDHIDELKKLGVDSLKVEGRLKTPQYVAQAAMSYREALTSVEANLSELKKSMEKTFSRGFFSGWYEGVNHQVLVDGFNSSHLGLFLGEILEVKSKTVVISASEILSAGQGLMFQTSERIGAAIFKVHEQKDERVELSLFNFELSKLKKGLKVYLNSDPEFDKKLSGVWEEVRQQKKIPLSLSFMENTLTLSDGKNSVTHELREMEPAQNEESARMSFLAAYSKMGGTPFELTHTEWNGISFFLQPSKIKELRRNMIDEMITLRKKVVNHLRPAILNLKTLQNKSETLKLNYLFRTKSQVDTWLKSDLSDPDSGFVILDFEFGKNYAESLSALKTRGHRVLLATTRILKPAEYYNLNTLMRLEPDGFLVRNLGALHYLKKSEKILWGDFSLNAANSLSVDYLLSKGLSGLNLSYDLNESQILEVLKNSDSSRLEVNLFHSLPEFHMEHCVFAAFLSSGTSFKDCGKVCEKHTVKIQDTYGKWHHLMADQECRNTMYRAEAQSALHSLVAFKKEGLGSMRFEALREEGEELLSKISVHQKVLKNEMSISDALKALGKVESYGVSSGQLKKKDNYLDRKKATHGPDGATI